MKLYNVPKNTWVTPLEHTEGPPATHAIEAGDPVLFFHIDGLYSYCKDGEGRVVHLPAWTEVMILER